MRWSPPVRLRERRWSKRLDAAPEGAATRWSEGTTRGEEHRSLRWWFAADLIHSGRRVREGEKVCVVGSRRRGRLGTCCSHGVGPDRAKGGAIVLGAFFVVLSKRSRSASADQFRHGERESAAAVAALRACGSIQVGVSSGRRRDRGKEFEGGWKPAPRRGVVIMRRLRHGGREAPPRSPQSIRGHRPACSLLMSRGMECTRSSSPSRRTNEKADVRQEPRRRSTAACQAAR